MPRNRYIAFAEDAMKLATILLNHKEEACIQTRPGVLPISVVNSVFKKKWSTDILELLVSGQFYTLKAWYDKGGRTQIESLAEHSLPIEDVRFGPLYRHPRKIWGIGLNYIKHASDLSEKSPTSAPASFSKFDTTVIGPGDTIVIPIQSNKTTGEAELAVIFGKECKNVPEKDWLSVVAGFTCVLDMTAEDILRENPRYLTRSKNFDTFFSFGPFLATPDEIDDICSLKVATVLNSEIQADNIVSNMTFPPDYLVSFHTHVATMLPGDIISTGTPRAVPLKQGDLLECRIDNFEPLINPVVDLKVKK